MYKNTSRTLAVLAASTLLFSACKKDNEPAKTSSTITIENVLNSKSLVESGVFGTSPLPPDQSISFSFYAGKGQFLTFASMYGWSNDLFFAPANPGIKLYNDDGSPATGDVSSQIKLWDNGTRVNQAPGANVTHPGVAEVSTKAIKEVSGMDDYGNAYLPASQLMNVSLVYNGNSQFTLTITNKSKGTANETPFSPGAWAISHLAGSNLVMPAPIYTVNQLSTNGLTKIAEMGNPADVNTYLMSNTGTFTGLSPVLVVVYQGIENPFYKVGEADRGQGLKYIAQMGNADSLASVLKMKAGVKNVYVLKDPTTNGPLLPIIGDAAGGKVSQLLSLETGDKIAIATMFGASSDWFFATKEGDIGGFTKGDVSRSIGLYDDGTAVDQFPGANIRPAPVENKPIQPLANPNSYTTLPAITDIIKVTLQ
jgi:hypothetical protein